MADKPTKLTGIRRLIIVIVVIYIGIFGAFLLALNLQGLPLWLTLLIFAAFTPVFAIAAFVGYKIHPGKSAQKPSSKADDSHKSGASGTDTSYR